MRQVRPRVEAARFLAALHVAALLLKREAGDAEGTKRALQELGLDAVDAVFVLAEPLLRRAGADIGPAAVAHRVSLLVGDPDLVGVPGVVASVGPDQRRMGVLAGELTARILNGAPPQSSRSCTRRSSSSPTSRRRARSASRCPKRRCGRRYASSVDPVLS